MEATPEELAMIMKLTSEIEAIQSDLDTLNSRDTEVVMREVNKMRRDVRETRQHLIQPEKKRHLTPDVECDEKNPVNRRYLEQNEPLFHTAPTPEERKTGRVKYVTKEEEKISYPLPNEYLEKEPKAFVAASLFVDLTKDEFCDIRQGNMAFEGVPYPKKTDPLFPLF